LEEVWKLFKFRFPEVNEIEVYLVRLPDGRIVARTREELEEIEKEIRQKSPSPQSKEYGGSKK